MWIVRRSVASSHTFTLLKAPIVSKLVSRSHMDRSGGWVNFSWVVTTYLLKSLSTT